MITGYFDDENKWTIWEKKEFEFFSPSFDYHMMTTLNKHPTATTLWRVHEGCERALWLDYNGKFYCHVDNLIFMIRGTLIHENALKDVPFKEFLVIVDNLFGSLDGFEYGGDIFEVKTVSKLPKIIPPAHAFQLLVYMWMLKQHNLPFTGFKSLYCTWWGRKVISGTPGVLPGLLGFSLEGGLTKFIHMLINKFNKIVNNPEPKIESCDAEQCKNCSYWNVCQEGRDENIKTFRETGKFPRSPPIWHESDLNKLDSNWIFRSNKLIETYSNGGVV